MELRDQVAIVTGASSGIGAAIARAFAAEGASLVLAARSEERLREVADSLAGAKRTVIVPTDVRELGQVRRMVERTVEEFGGVDILVNNAGIGMYAPYDQADWAYFRELWEVNFFAAAYAMREVLPLMKQRRRGTIVNISSVAGRIPLPFLSSYCSTKFALNALSDGVRTEVAGDGIRVVVICPGRVQTPFHSRAYYHEGHTGYRGRIGRGITAERVARATLRAVLSGQREVVIPWVLRLAIGFRKLFPALTDRLIRAAIFGQIRA
ncbi:MAG: SDR family oxidoreductase [Acidobacteria bacterium]|nr:SDR family oxidoreductase [Acidobacteriota bacterium]